MTVNYCTITLISDKQSIALSHVRVAAALRVSLIISLILTCLTLLKIVWSKFCGTGLTIQRTKIVLVISNDVVLGSDWKTTFSSNNHTLHIVIG